MSKEYERVKTHATNTAVYTMYRDEHGQEFWHCERAGEIMTASKLFSMSGAEPADERETEDE